MFNVPVGKKKIEKHLKQNYQQINYNKFRWWRWYQDKNTPLPTKEEKGYGKIMKKMKTVS